MNTLTIFARNILRLTIVIIRRIKVAKKVYSHSHSQHPMWNGILFSSSGTMEKSKLIWTRLYLPNEQAWQAVDLSKSKPVCTRDVIYLFIGTGSSACRYAHLRALLLYHKYKTTMATEATATPYCSINSIGPFVYKHSVQKIALTHAPHYFKCDKKIRHGTNQMWCMIMHNIYCFGSVIWILATLTTRIPINPNISVIFHHSFFSIFIFFYWLVDLMMISHCVVYTQFDFFVITI